MTINLVRSFLLFAFVVSNASCGSLKNTTQPSASITKLRFRGQYIVPNNLIFNNTVIGGLSGIDYDKKSNQYFLISDDRSEKNPARFYNASIAISEKGIDTVLFTSVTYLQQANGSLFPNKKNDRYNVPDPESIRFNPSINKLIWSSEGERILNKEDTVLINPSINIVTKKGKYKGDYTIPQNLQMQSFKKGPRRNGVFEGICFANNFKILFVSVEEPLYEDGPRADTIENNALIRLFKFDVKQKKCVAQFAYKLSPVAYKPIPSTAFYVNGVPEILSLGNNKLLVIERSFSEGRLPCTIKLFIVDISQATDISNTSLEFNNNFKPVKKELLFNMDDLGFHIDNIEGVTFGPQLPNGNKTLLFVADNNFNNFQKTQFLLFEIIE